MFFKSYIIMYIHAYKVWYLWTFFSKTENFVLRSPPGVYYEFSGLVVIVHPGLLRLGHTNSAGASISGSDRLRYRLRFPVGPLSFLLFFTALRIFRPFRGFHGFGCRVPDPMALCLSTVAVRRSRRVRVCVYIILRVREMRQKRADREEIIKFTNHY